MIRYIRFPCLIFTKGADAVSGVKQKPLLNCGRCHSQPPNGATAIIAIQIETLQAWILLTAVNYAAGNRTPF